jgi:hypothetical protein
MAMAFMILKDEMTDQDGFISDFIYFDEENTEAFNHVISRYARRVREIRFERAVKIEELLKLNQIFAKYI